MSQFNFGSNMGKDTRTMQLLYYGKVVSNIDDKEAKRIKVRIDGLDDALTDDKLPYSFPILPKNISVLPKINELVIVMIADMGNSTQDRFYFGSLTPQQNQLFHSDVLTAQAGLNSGKAPFNVPSRKIPETTGVYSNSDDLNLEGRSNAEIRFDTNRLMLRVGKHTNEKIQNVPVLNTTNQTYIDMRHDVSLFGSDKTFSVMNIVSDKINLLTHENGSPRFNINGGDNPISDEEMIEILMNSHPLPFGDKLVEYLLLMRSVLINHVHPYTGMKPTNLNGEESIKKLLEFDVTGLISKNIRIN